MDRLTDEFHDIIANFEPTYLVLMEAACGYGDDQLTLPEARDLLRDAVEAHTGFFEQCGRQASEIADVDFAAMIQYELG